RSFRLLSANVAANAAQWGDRLTAVHARLGTQSDVVAAAIDACRGDGPRQPGNGTMAPRTLAPTTLAPTTLAPTTLADVIAEHPAFRDAGLLKIDTDGFDIAILRGAQVWLAAAQPVLFFEYDPHFWPPVTPDGGRLFGELAELGYGPLIAYDNFGWL